MGEMKNGTRTGPVPTVRQEVFHQQWSVLQKTYTSIEEALGMSRGIRTCLMLGVSRTSLPLMRRATPGSSRYAILCAIFTILIFGAAHLLFDHFGTNDRGHRVLAFIFVATLILVNAAWNRWTFHGADEA
jgi:hypothetical protein